MIHVFQAFPGLLPQAALDGVGKFLSDAFHEPSHTGN